MIYSCFLPWAWHHRKMADVLIRWTVRDKMASVSQLSRIQATPHFIWFPRTRCGADAHTATSGSLLFLKQYNTDGTAATDAEKELKLVVETLQTASSFMELPLAFYICGLVLFVCTVCQVEWTQYWLIDWFIELCFQAVKCSLFVPTETLRPIRPPYWFSVTLGLAWK